MSFSQNEEVVPLTRESPKRSRNQWCITFDKHCTQYMNVILVLKQIGLERDPYTCHFLSGPRSGFSFNLELRDCSLDMTCTDSCRHGSVQVQHCYISCCIASFLCNCRKRILKCTLNKCCYLNHIWSTLSAELFCSWHRGRQIKGGSLYFGVLL